MATTTDISEIMRELAVSRETAIEISGYRAAENERLVREWEQGGKAAKIAQCRAAYDQAVAEYKARRPGGKNAAKAGLRAARAIWSGYVRGQ